MERKCENCYWFPNGKCMLDEIATNEVCKRHDYPCVECENEIAEFKLDNKFYCSECLEKELDIERVPIATYWWDSEFIGDENEDLIDVYKKVDRDVEEL